MKKRLAVPLAVVATSLLIGASAGGASAHFLANDSVDGRDIRYEDNTKWDDSRTWAEARWEEIPGDAELHPDSWKTNADLQIGDYNANDDRCGYWQPRTGADLMKLNDAFYNGANGNDRRNCTVHEFGHAFGLDHSYSDQVMDACPVEACGRSYDRPQAHDKADFLQKWPD